MAKVFYRLFGPTTIHLEHEICLWVTSMCLTIASLSCLYRSSFGIVGDLFYLLLTNLWLSRHFLHRLICTADVGTSLSKSPLQTLRWMWIIVTTGGQYFDVPTSVFDSSDNDVNYIDEYARHARDGAAIAINIGAMDGPMGIASSSMNLKDAIVKLLALGWASTQMLLKAIRITSFSSKQKEFDFDDDDWTTTTTASSGTFKHRRGSAGGGSTNATHGNVYEKDSFGYKYNKCKKKLNRKIDVCWRYSPPVQLLVFIFSGCFIIWFALKYKEAQSSYAIPLRAGRNAFFDSNMINYRMNDEAMAMHMNMHGNNHNWTPNTQYDVALNAEFMTRKYALMQGGDGASAIQARDFIYSWYGMMCMVAVWGTIGSLILYGRIMPPLPDLVAGAPGNVGKGSHVS
jgi:hypothetical protein